MFYRPNTRALRKKQRLAQFAFSRANQQVLPDLQHETLPNQPIKSEPFEMYLFAAFNC